MFKKILTKTILMFDTLYKRLYSTTKNNTALGLLTDYSTKHNELNLNDFIDARWHIVVRELYTIMNDYYNSKLSALIVEWNDQEIAKLKYLKIILLDIKDTLNNNVKD